MLFQSRRTSQILITAMHTLLEMMFFNGNSVRLTNYTIVFKWAKIKFVLKQHFIVALHIF